MRVGALDAMTILPCRDPAHLARLVPLAAAEGFGHLARLVAEWTDGTNRFEGDGELLLAVEVEGRVVACGGFTGPSATLGRIRRLYVDPAARCRGVGMALVAALIERARGRFAGLVLHTDDSSAAHLYERLEFVPEKPTGSMRTSHRLSLRD